MKTTVTPPRRVVIDIVLAGVIFFAFNSAYAQSLWNANGASGVTTNRIVSVKTTNPTADFDINGTLRVRNLATFDSSITARSLYSYYLAVSGNSELNELSVTGIARFYRDVIVDSLLTGWRTEAQEAQFGSATITGNLSTNTLTVISTSQFSGNASFTTLAANETGTGTLTVSGNSYVDSILTAWKISAQEITSGALQVTGTLHALKISADTLLVNGAGMMHALLLTDGVVIQPFAGTTAGGIVRYNTNGKLKNLDFPTDTNAVLTGGGAFKNIGTMVAPYSGWQWYNANVLLSTAPVVAIQNNLAVGGKVSIGSLRMSNGSATDTLATDRRFALEAEKIFLKADTVIMQKRVGTENVYSPSGTLGLEADTVKIRQLATAQQIAATGIAADSIGAGRIRTVALEVSGDIEALNGTVRSNEVRTQNINSALISTDSLEVNGSIHIRDSVKIGNSIWLGGKDQNTLTNNIYTDNDDLFLQSSPLNFNTIFNAVNSGKVVIGNLSPVEKFNVKGNSFFDGDVTITQRINLPLGAQNGYVLTSNATGIAGWRPLPIQPDFWTISGNNIYNNNTSGNVGIGTIMPMDQFQIGDIFTFNDGSSGLGYRRIGSNVYWDKGTLSEKRIQAGTAVALLMDGGIFSVLTADNDIANSIIFFNEAFEVMNNGNIFASKRVGVGTIPQTRLHILSDECTTTFRIENQGATACTGLKSSLFDITAEGETGGLLFSTPALSVPVMKLDKTGNVGIGTITPYAKLDVFENTTDAFGLTIGDMANRILMFMPNVNAALWNAISIPGDIGLFFRNQSENIGNSGFVIAPQHSGDPSGIRISPEGFVGIGTSPLTNPLSPLVVENKENITNKVIASFNKRSSDDTYLKNVFIVSHLSQGGFNSLSRVGDAGIFWSDNSLSIDLSTGVELSTLQQPSTTNMGLVIGMKGGTTGGIRITEDGDVGIGTPTPAAQLEVQRSSADYAMVITNGNSEGKGLLIKAGSGTSASSDYAALEVQDNTGYKVFRVDGHTNKVYMRGFKSTITVFPDYVFEKDYSLMSLAELENYLKKYKHLPGMPSAKEIEGQEVDIPELIGKQFEKTEELFLYVIELYKENQELKRNQKKQNDRMEELNAKIEMILKTYK